MEWACTDFQQDYDVNSAVQIRIGVEEGHEKGLPKQPFRDEVAEVQTRWRV